MIQLRRDTDYALVIMGHLMTAPKGTLLSAKAISTELKLPYPTVSKVLKLLNKKEILSSVQGPRGGYAITGNTQNVSVGHIIEAVEGPIALTQCSASSAQSCESQKHCGVSPHLIAINRVVRTSLLHLPLQALASPLKKLPQPKDMTHFWNEYFTLEKGI